jgi:hypothetical protein
MPLQKLALSIECQLYVARRKFADWLSCSDGPLGGFEFCACPLAGSSRLQRILFRKARHQYFAAMSEQCGDATRLTEVRELVALRVRREHICCFVFSFLTLKKRYMQRRRRAMVWYLESVVLARLWSSMERPGPAMARRLDEIGTDDEPSVLPYELERCGTFVRIP